MAEYKSHYAAFDVMKEEEHWDDHTRKVVNKRLKTQTFYPYGFFTQQEADTLTELCSVLFDDRRNPVIAYVVHHFDTTLKGDVGESQRKVGVPKQAFLIRDGLQLLDEVCEREYRAKFSGLKEIMKQVVVGQLVQGSLVLQSGEKSVPVKDFMQKMTSEAVSAYYSHPIVWSEIGYAGPAYPRGYVRSELGLTDPWEAKQDGPSSR